MNPYRKTTLQIIIAITFWACLPAQPESGRKAAGTAEDVVKKLYELVSFDAGKTPDWDQVKATFVEEAVIVLRTSRDSTTVFSLEGFVQDFVKFSGREDVQKNGFREKILRMKTDVMGDMAHILVLYEAHIPGSTRPPQKGVDSCLLSRRENGWKIVAITNEIPTPENPMPEALRD
jgi:hypothetical protein